MTRYQIQYADPVITAWKSCFKGMNIGNGFIAPIVTRQTGASASGSWRQIRGEPQSGKLRPTLALGGR